MHHWRRAFPRYGVGLLLFLVGVWTVPHWWCGREGGAWHSGDAELQSRLARGLERWIAGDLSRADFATGSALFNGEWLYGAYMMAGMGFGQTALEHPEWRERHAALMRRCIDRLISPEVRAFDREAWGHDPLDTLDGDEAHGAYLGYLNLLLSLHRRLDPASPRAPLNDRITEALARRIERSPTLLLESYPGQTFPVDNAAAIGSIGLYDRATGADHRALIGRWAARCREAWVDRGTGLLYQAVDPATAAPADRPRGSGTGLAVYFLSYADPALSRELFEAFRRELAGTLLGFGVVREYPSSAAAGRGDIDSGPIVLGYGLTATGLALAGSRIHGDPALFSRVYATAYLFGAPYDRGDRREFVTGGPLGNALMFALLTAPRGGLGTGTHP